jgi:TolB-like protein/DNA-binding SARP family transcriptional activator/Tfp pilus assembly protein PilF
MGKHGLGSLAASWRSREENVVSPMFFFRTLGNASLQGPTGTLVGRVVQRRRLALLALLATAGNAGRSRDKLIGYLWPEAKARKARHLLSDSLYVLHRALGKDALLVSGDEIRLNSQVIRADVVELEWALDDQDLEAVVSCYRGPFLDGFHLSDAADLERWIENERDIYAKICREALETLAQQCETSSDVSGAIEWCRRLTLHEPYSTQAVIRLARNLLTVGDKGEALRVARAHTLLLKDELDLEPPQELLDLAAEIESKSARRPEPSADTASASVNRPAPPPAKAAPAQPPRAPPRSWRRLRRFATGLGLLTFTLTAVWFGGQPVFESGPAAKSVAVLPLVNLSDQPESDYFTDGITAEIIGALSKIADLEVTSRTSTMAFKGTREPIPDIGRRLNVAAILEGELQHDGEFLRINVRLIDTRSDKLIWAKQYNRMLGELFAIQSDVAQNIATTLSASLTTAEKERIERAPTENLDAYDYYLQGHQYFLKTFTERDLRIAQRMYQRAVALDPTFALAYARLSETHSYIFWFHYDHSHERATAAREAAERARQLAPDAPEVHRAVAYYLYHCQLDYKQALTQFNFSVAAQPSDEYTWMGIAAVRRRQGDFLGAIEAFERALEIDPLSTVLAENTATTYAALGEFSMAEHYIDKAIALRPDYSRPYGRKALMYLSWNGNIERAREALRVCAWEIGPTTEPYVLIASLFVELYDRQYGAALQRLTSAFPETVESQYYVLPRTLLLGHTYQLMGDVDRAVASYDSARAILEEKRRQDFDDPRLHSAVGIAYAGLGFEQQAIHAGELAVELMPISKEARRGVYRLEDLAWIYVLTGHHDAAVEKLEQLLSVPGEITATRLRLDPKWDPLRDHARFQAMLAAKSYADD